MWSSRQLQCQIPDSQRALRTQWHAPLAARGGVRGWGCTRGLTLLVLVRCIRVQFSAVGVLSVAVSPLGRCVAGGGGARQHHAVIVSIRTIIPCLRMVGQCGPPLVWPSGAVAQHSGAASELAVAAASTALWHVTMWRVGRCTACAAQPGVGQGVDGPAVGLLGTLNTGCCEVPVLQAAR